MMITDDDDCDGVYDDDDDWDDNDDDNDNDEPGGTLYFSIWGIHVNIWGLRFYKTIIFGACEFQLKKNSIFWV